MAKGERVWEREITTRATGTNCPCGIRVPPYTQHRCRGDNQAAGQIRALLEALESKHALIWNGSLVLAMKYEPSNEALWAAQAHMVLDEDDFAILREAFGN